MALKSAEKTETNVFTLELISEPKTFEDAIQKVYNKQKGQIALPGFRKGKAPRAFIEKYYGENVFYDDALEMVFPTLYEAAIEEAGIEPVSSPYDFDVKEINKSGFELVCKVVVKPEIELPKYKGLTAEKDDVEVTDDEVNNKLDSMREENSRMITVEDRAVAEGDIAVIDFEGFADGVAFEGGKAEGHELTIGAGQFIPGFEEQLIGHNSGEEFDINVKFPEEYAEELAGKDAVFKIKLNEIKLKELPEADDEFAKDVSEYDTLEELKESLKKELLENKQQAAEKQFESALLDMIAEGVVGEIPDAMIEKAIDDIVNDFEYRMRMQGMELDMYLQYTGMTIESMRESYKERAVRDVKLRLAVEKIAEVEKIEISPEETQAEYQRFADLYKMELDTVKKAVSEKDLNTDLKSKKVVELVVSNAKAEPKKEEKETKEPVKKETKEKASEKKPTAKKAPAEKKTQDKKPAAKKTAAKKTEDKA